MDNPKVQDFHRLQNRGNFIAEEFLPLIRPAAEGRSKIAGYFSEVRATLSYRPGGDDIGLPKQAFPALGRPFVQVLLRLAQSSYMKNGEDPTRRKDVLRLVVSWMIGVTDAPKASRLAYDVIKKKEPELSNALGHAIHSRLVQEGVAVQLRKPDDIKLEHGLAFSTQETEFLRGESRFVPS